MAKRSHALPGSVLIPDQRPIPKSACQQGTSGLGFFPGGKGVTRAKDHLLRARRRPVLDFPRLP